MIQLPPSKSIAARYMVATFFAGTLPADPIFQDNDDLLVLQQALLEVFSDEEPIDYGDSPIDVGASGTALRFLTAVCASSPGADYVITGTPRLMQRPMAPLINLLKKAGAEVSSLGEDNQGPYRVTGAKLKGGDFDIPGNISSQFISALMLVAPYWEKGMKLDFSSEPVSRPYIEMTARLMEKFGIKPLLTDKYVVVPDGKYIDTEDFKVEADWSSASFFFEACALGAKDISIENLPSPDLSLQGDAAADEIFHKIGVKADYSEQGASLSLCSPFPDKVEIDFKDCPDLVLPFAVACLCSGIKFKFSNVAHLRLKESDRIDSLQKEAGKLGFVVEADDNNIYWKGKKDIAETDPVIDPHDDHRVAMAFAIAALKTGKIKIENPRVVQKSFIDFWNQIPKIGLTCTEENNIMIVSK